MAKRKKRGEEPSVATSSGEEASASKVADAPPPIAVDKSEVSERTVVDPEILTKFLVEQAAKEAAKAASEAAKLAATEQANVADLRRVDDELEALMPSAVPIEPTNSGEVSPIEAKAAEPQAVEEEESTGKGYWDEDSVAKDSPSGGESAGDEGRAAEGEPSAGD
jgi:hypothetical protein